MALLERQPWPGNVRQLQNLIERLVILSDGDQLTMADVERELGRRPAIAAPVATTFVASADSQGPQGRQSQGGERRLDARGATAPAAGTLADSRRGAEKDALRAALDRAKNNRSMAARLLGISRRTLYHKLDEHGLI